MLNVQQAVGILSVTVYYVNETIQVAERSETQLYNDQLCLVDSPNITLIEINLVKSLYIHIYIYIYNR